MFFFPFEIQVVCFGVWCFFVFVFFVVVFCFVLFFGSLTEGDCKTMSPTKFSSTFAAYSIVLMYSSFIPVEKSKHMMSQLRHLC